MFRTARPIVILALIGCLGWTPAWALSPAQKAYDQGAAAYQRADYFAAAGAFHQATVLDPGMLRAWEALGWAWRKLGRNDDAMRIWSTLLKIEPDHPEILNEFGAIHAQRRQYRQAIADYRRSLDLDPAQPRLHLLLGDIYQNLDRVEQAVAEYLRAAADEGQRERAYLRVIALYEAVDQREKAIDFIARQVKQGRASTDLKKRLARLYADEARAAFERGAFERAAANYQRAIELGIDSAVYYAGLGWVYRRQGRAEAAISAWRQALALEPQRHNLEVAIADTYRDSGDDASARQWYRRAYEHADDSLAIFRLVDSALENGDQLGAAWWAEKLLASEVTRDSWVDRLARLYIDRGRPDWGLNFFTLSSTRVLSGRHGAAVAELYAAQGNTLYREGNYLVAQAYYEQALALDPDNWNALRDLGWTYWRQQRWSDCARVWQRLQRLAPEMPEPYNLFTQFYLERGDYAMAIANARRSLELAPDQPRQRLRLARAYYLDQQFGQARSLAAQLAARYKDDVEIQKFQARLLSRYRDYEGARAQWAIVLELDPDTPGARKRWLRARYELGEFEAAIAGFKALLEAQGPDEEILRLLASDARAQGQLGEAALWYEKLVEYWPERVGYWISLARIYSRDGRLNFAQNTLVRASWFHPDNIDIQQKLAMNFADRGLFDEAAERFRQIHESSPNHRGSYVGWVHALINGGRFDEARALLEAPQARYFWKDYEIELLRARILAEEGRHEGADAIRRRIAEPPGEGDYIPFLLYHGISDNPRDEGTLYRATFEAHLRALKAAGYTGLTLTEFEQMLDGKLARPDKAVVITFDDARRDAFRQADPLLEKYGFKATMFVSTAEIVDDHPFHLDWPGMRAYQRSGRWDFQSHGHDAHRAIVVDAEGHRGSFLVNRMWLADKQRSETEAEYRRRIEGDYRLSIQILERELGQRPSVYAFPYSEAGQQHFGNESSAYQINLELVRRHFRFGAVQDQSGYNLVSRGRLDSILLRRYNVGHDMSAEALMRLLAHKEPRNIARLAMAQSRYWDGRFDEARALFEQLDAADAAPRARTRFYLGGIDFFQGRYREADRHLKEALAASGSPSPGAERLYRQLQWRLRPSLGFEARRTGDSNDRNSTLLAGRYRHPLSLNRPVEVALGLGSLLLEEKGYEPIPVRQYDLTLLWRQTPELTFAADLRSRGGAGYRSTGLGAELRYQGRGLRIDGRLGREDVDTLRAFQAGIQADRALAKLTVDLARHWRTQWTLDYRGYSDGNRRGDGRIALVYDLPQLPRWRLLLQQGYSDSGRDSDLYYTPVALATTEWVMRYNERPEFGEWRLESELALGWAQGDNAADRLTYRASAGAQRYWLDTLRTRLEASYQNTTSYDSWAVGVSADYLF